MRTTSPAYERIKHQKFIREANDKLHERESRKVLCNMMAEYHKQQIRKRKKSLWQRFNDWFVK